ncbi:hypothetical protein AAFF_G00060030 [Aldrovandia affinis]|uniref:Uncharacterized protein n=1 Tax=Aldrovandia affinis TaxID=143900 RepID=A0AAD7S0C5_9TELE|nr:hypothetical protein AAFF_G00060030 [Aldrovandia affinis]
MEITVGEQGLCGNGRNADRTGEAGAAEALVACGTDINYMTSLAVRGPLQGMPTATSATGSGVIDPPPQHPKISLQSLCSPPDQQETRD